VLILILHLILCLFVGFGLIEVVLFTIISMLLCVNAMLLSFYHAI